jgi:hypothetical protein
MTSWQDQFELVTESVIVSGDDISDNFVDYSNSCGCRPSFGKFIITIKFVLFLFYDYK